MNQAEFDGFADEYYKQHRDNIAITGESPEYFSEYKTEVVARYAYARRLRVGNLLDFGSGIGNSIPYLRRRFSKARLVSADVSQRSLDLAEERYPGLSESLLIEDRRIPLEDGLFDVCFSACVFHHIPHDEHLHWLAELRRVTRPGGMLIIFEHNPLNPLTVRAVNTCPFDANARLIKAKAFAKSYQASGWHNVSLNYHLFFPRALAGLRSLEPFLSFVPFGGQYSLTAIKAA